jgi:hypothetical protein
MRKEQNQGKDAAADDEIHNQIGRHGSEEKEKEKTINK